MSLALKQTHGEALLFAARHVEFQLFGELVR